MTTEQVDRSVIARLDTIYMSKRRLVYPLAAPIIIILAVIIAFVAKSTKGWVIGLVFLIAAAYLLFNGLSQVRLVELTPGTLRWRSVLRRQEMPLRELRQLRPASDTQRAASYTAMIIEFRYRRQIRLLVTDGLPEFAAALRQAAPNLEISLP